MFTQLEWDIYQHNDLYEFTINPYITEWFISKVPYTESDIRKLEKEANKREHSRTYFLENIGKYISTEVAEEYNKLQATPLFRLQRLLHFVSFYVFFYWREFFHYHSQNLRKDDDKNLVNWRCWLTLHNGNLSFKIIELHLQLVIGLSDWFGFIVEFGGEDFFHLSIKLFFIRLYLTLDSIYIWRLLNRFNLQKAFYHPKTLGFSYIENTILFYLFRDEGGNLLDRMYSINLVDLILGKEKYDRQIISVEAAVVPMPEKDYYGTATLFKIKLTRPRFGIKKEYLRCEIEVSEGIPIPGKGENDWDIEEDASYSMCSLYKGDIAAHIEDYRNSILDRRKKYGGLNWKPTN